MNPVVKIETATGKSDDEILLNLLSDEGYVGTFVMRREVAEQMIKEVTQLLQMLPPKG